MDTFCELEQKLKDAQAVQTTAEQDINTCIREQAYTGGELLDLASHLGAGYYDKIGTALEELMAEALRNRDKKAAGDDPFHLADKERPGKLFYSVEETLEKLDVNPQALTEMVNAGKIREYRDGPKMIFKVEEIHDYLNTHKRS
jgi:hypothetical protein